MKNTMNSEKNAVKSAKGRKEDIFKLVNKIDDEKKLDAIYRYIKIVYLNNR